MAPVRSRFEVDCGDTYMGNRTVCDPNPCIPTADVDSGNSGSHALFLGTPYPSPTTGEVEVAWSLPAAGFARLTVWDATGRRMTTLFEGEVGAGSVRRAFKLADGAGRVFPSGVYWLKLESGDTQTVQKVLIAN